MIEKVSPIFKEKKMKKTAFIVVVLFLVTLGGCTKKEQ